jgi:hypothetical protein
MYSPEIDPNQNAANGSIKMFLKKDSIYFYFFEGVDYADYP